MPAPITETFAQMTLETSSDGTTWTKICGLVGVTVNRTAQIDEDEVPQDCDDETLPMDVKREVRSISVSASAEGFWAQQSHEMMLDWFYGGGSRRVRLGNQNAAVGDTQYETGFAFLSNLSNTRTKGRRVTASVELTFDGTPTRTAKAA